MSCKFWRVPIRRPYNTKFTNRLRKKKTWGPRGTKKNELEQISTNWNENSKVFGRLCNKDKFYKGIKKFVGS